MKPVSRRRLRHVVRILTGLIFVACIATPSILTWYSNPRSIAASEKRFLANLPALDWTAASLNSFPARFEAYYDDHFGLRRRLIHGYNYFKTIWLHQSPVDDVMLGKHRWLYYDGNHVLDDYLGHMRIDTPALAEWRQTLQTRSDWLHRLGARYLFVIVPNKQSVYPEYLPDHIRAAAGRPMRDMLTAFVATTPDVHVLDLTPTLLSAKARAASYFRTDTHWTRYGALQGSRVIGTAVQRLLPGTTLPPLAPVTLSSALDAGDLAVMLDLPGVLTERYPTVTVLHNCARPAPNPYHFTMPEDGTVDVYRCPAATLRALVIHDSFGDLFKDLLGQYFAETVFIDRGGFDEIEHIIRTVRPDIVIDERTERFLPEALVLEPRLERQLYQQPFEHTSRRLARLDINSPTPIFQETNMLHVSRTTAGLRLQATGSDPYGVFPLPAPASNGIVLMRIRLRAPASTVLRVFYTSDGQPDFDLAHSLMRRIQAGDNEIYLRLPHGALPGRLRLDPGQIAGDYVLHSLEILSVAGFDH